MYEQITSSIVMSRSHSRDTASSREESCSEAVSPSGTMLLASEATAPSHQLLLHIPKALNGEVTILHTWGQLQRLLHDQLPFTSLVPKSKGFEIRPLGLLYDPVRKQR